MILNAENAAVAAEQLGVPAAWAFWGLPPLLVLAGYAVGRAAEWLLARWISPIAARSGNAFDDAFVRAFRGPLRAVGAVLGAALALLLAPLPAPWRPVGERIVAGVLFVVGAVILARLAAGLVRASATRARLAPGTRSLAERIAVSLVVVVSTLTFLDVAGVSITPLLTTLGLAGLALALALQDTLGNFFAGVYVQADRPLDIGHYVRFDGLRVEGYVVEVGWRTTKIRTLQNNLVVIPNSIVAGSVVIDYDLPEPRMSLLVAVPVSRDADLRRVEAILVEEAKSASRDVSGLLAEPAPFVRFIPGFTESGYEVTLICQVASFVDQYLVQHELRERIVRRLAVEGIALALPVRLVRAERTAGY